LGRLPLAPSSTSGKAKKGIKKMALPIDSQIKTYADAIIAYCDKQILLNQPNPADAAEIATDKVEQIAAYTAYKTQARGFYAL
jgi:hypothetical protein